MTELVKVVKNFLQEYIKANQKYKKIVEKLNELLSYVKTSDPIYYEQIYKNHLYMISKYLENENIYINGEYFEEEKMNKKFSKKNFFKKIETYTNIEILNIIEFIFNNPNTEIDTISNFLQAIYDKILFDIENDDITLVLN